MHLREVRALCHGREDSACMAITIIIIAVMMTRSASLTPPGRNITPPRQHAYIP